MGIEVVTNPGHIDSRGRLIQVSAPELAWEPARNIWMMEANRFSENRWLNRNNYQIAVCGHSGDAVSKLSHYLASKQNSFPNGVMRIQRKNYDDGEYDLLTVGEKKAHVLYLVASVLDAVDLENVERIAAHCRSTLGYREIVGLFSFFGSGRSDKNVLLIKESEVSKYEEVYEHEGVYYVYEPRTSAIRTRMQTLSMFFNRVGIIETHSGATQAFAFESGLPLISLSPWLWMIDEAIDNGFDFNGITVVRPDMGRNIASLRLVRELLARGYDVMSAACEKQRLGGNKVKMSLRPGDIEKVRNRRGFGYDDEVSTASTYGALFGELMKAGAIGMMAMYVHPKFVGEWQQNLLSPFLTRIVGTNSRLPIGDINNLGERHEAWSLDPFLYKWIMADVKGVNFWDDPYWRKMVLQDQPEERG